MTVGSDYHGMMTPDKIKQTLAEYRNSHPARIRHDAANLNSEKSGPQSKDGVRLNGLDELDRYREMLQSRRNPISPS